MKILLNNRPEEFDESSLTVEKLIELKRFTFKMLIVKINNNLVKKEDYGKAVISDGDNVSVIHLISGG